MSQKSLLLTTACQCAAVLCICSSVQAAPLNAGEASAADETEALLGEPLDLSTPLPNTPMLAKPSVSSKFSARPLPPNGWDAKVGLDQQAPPSPVPVLPTEPLAPNATAAPSSAVGWATVTAPSLGAPWSWDKASIETRIDPLQEQSKVGTTFSRSIPVGRDLSMTWQNGLWLTETRTGTPALPSTTIAPTTQGAAPVYGSNQAVKLDLLPTNTAISIGATRSSTEERWLRSLSAEQKLLGGPLSLTGSVSETSTGDFNKSLKAGFKKTW